MACFTVPLAEAVVLTAVKKIAFKRNADSVINEAEMTKNQKIAVLKEKFRILEKMLYGGSFLLAVEHLYHGEISLVPPFLTAMKNPAEIPEMLREMTTVGVGMALLTTRMRKKVWQERAAANPRKKNAASGTFVPTFRRESLPRRRQNFLLFRAMKNMAARTAPTEHRKKRSCKEWRNAKFAEKPQALFP